MTKKPPRTMDEINKETDELWTSFKELNKGKYKDESAAFRRGLRNEMKKRFAELYDEMADRDWLDGEEAKKGKL